MAIQCAIKLKMLIFFAAKNASQTVDDKLNALKSTERNDDWLSVASVKLCPIIRRLKQLTSSNSIAIRKELFQLSDALLRDCQKYEKKKWYLLFITINSTNLFVISPLLSLIET